MPVSALHDRTKTNGPVLARTPASLSAWLDQRPEEEVIEPHLPIIDAHHHMWWRPPDAYQLPELMAELNSGHDVRSTVFVQCAAMYRADGPDAMRPVGETEYVVGVAAVSASGLFGDRRLCAGIVGYADLRLGDAVVPVLEAHCRIGGARFKGIRQQAQYDPDIGALAKYAPPRGLLADPLFRSGFTRLAPMGLSFDTWVYFTQLGEVADLATAFPDTSIIVNHLGAPLGVGRYSNRRTEVFEIWSRGIRALARCPNVTIKLGGMGMASYGFGFADQPRPASSVELANAWRPYVELCIEAFGPARCMFESNFPVDKQVCSYRTLWNSFKRIATSYSDTEKADLFGGTAARTYRLSL